MYHNDLPDMSEALRQVYEKKQLDSVGAEDKDIDNDGDHDKTDSYLLNRRKKVSKAMGKKTHICAKLVGYKKEEWETIPEQHTMLEDGTVTHYDIKNGDTILENVPVEDLDILISEKHEHFDNYDKNAEVLGETKLGDTAYARARDAGAQRRRTKEYKQGLNRSTTRKEKGMYRLATAQRRTDADLERQKTTYDTGAHKGDFDRAKRAKQYKKEAFAFSDIELEELALLEEIDAVTDEQLIDMMEDLIIETAEDIDDLIEICEHLEQVEMLSEEERDAGAMAREKLNKPAGPSRMDRLKSAAKKAGSKLKAGAMKAGAAAKKGIKAAGKSAAANAGKAVGTFQANRIKAKRAELSKKDAPKKEAPKSSSSDDDGTGGKLDALIAKTRGTSGGSSSGGGSSSASSGGGERKGPGLLRKIGSAVKKGLKKAVGKTARAVSSGSDKLAKRMNEDYDKIAHLHESGLFSIEEIENVIEEGYKPIDKKKENKMYRRAGNLSREALSKGMSTKEGSKAQDKSGKIVSAITRQKEKERFDKMVDHDARK